MIPVYQTQNDSVYGDCFRACVASIMEFNIEVMPNFWNQTQDVEEFWRLVDEWLGNHSFTAFHIEPFLKPKDLICIAFFNKVNETGGHAVVWRNGIIHDPSKIELDLEEEPTLFTILVYLHPENLFKRKERGNKKIIEYAKNIKRKVYF